MIQTINVFFFCTNLTTNPSSNRSKARTQKNHHNRQCIPRADRMKLTVNSMSFTNASIKYLPFKSHKPSSKILTGRIFNTKAFHATQIDT